jgi:hypothetical protein
MASPTLSQNFVPNEPELKDLVNLVKKDIFLSLNCHHVGTIQTFDSANQTATATINYKRTYFKPDPITGGSVPYLVDYPLLLDCPVICLGGGAASLRFPITTGDECLILFNDRDIDNWLSTSSTSSGVATTRLHSFSDGIILVGVRSVSNVLESYSNSAVELVYGGNKISLDATKFKADLASGVSLEIDATGKLKITNGVGEFVSMLVQLFNDIQSGLVTTLLGPQPLIMPTFSTDLAELESFKS